MLPVRRSYNFFGHGQRWNGLVLGFTPEWGGKMWIKILSQGINFAPPGEEGFELATLGLRSKMSTNRPQSRTKVPNKCPPPFFRKIYPPPDLIKDPNFPVFLLTFFLDDKNPYPLKGFASLRDSASICCGQYIKSDFLHIWDPYVLLRSDFYSKGLAQCPL